MTRPRASASRHYARIGARRTLGVSSLETAPMSEAELEENMDEPPFMASVTRRDAFKLDQSYVTQAQIDLRRPRLAQDGLSKPRLA